MRRIEKALSSSTEINTGDKLRITFSYKENRAYIAYILDLVDEFVFYKWWSKHLHLWVFEKERLSFFDEWIGKRRVVLMGEVW